MSTADTRTQSNKLGPALEILGKIAMAFMVIAMVAIVATGSGLVGGAATDDPVISVPVNIEVPDDFAGRLGLVADTAEPTSIEVSGPILAQIGFVSPSSTQRTVWIIWQVLGPMLGIAGVWQVLGIARSVRDGDPFTEANERRLWRLAFIVAIGGSAYLWLGEAARAWLVASSVTSEFAVMELTLSFMPVIAGIVVAALASVWHIGVGLREDVAGTI